MCFLRAEYTKLHDESAKLFCAYFDRLNSVLKVNLNNSKNVNTLYSI